MKDNKHFDEFQRQIEDILDHKEPTKKVNSGEKGRRNERNLCKVLTTRFGVSFERSVGSGNRWKQVKHLSKSSRDVLVGDVVCPDDFSWVLECKSGYEDKVDFHSLFVKGNKTIDDFLVQVTKDSGRSLKLPMLLYKRNMKPWLAFVRTENLPSDVEFVYKIQYRDWTIVLLDKLLEAPDSYFFKAET